MFYKLLLPVVGLMLMSASAQANTEQETNEQRYQPVSAKYRVTSVDSDAHKDTADWMFSRDGKQVMTSSGEYAEVWQRDERGELTLARVFHHDRKLIQYTSGELRTQRRLKDWRSLNGFFDPRDQAGLNKVEEITFMGRPASRYTGKAGKDAIEVIWLEKDAMLARFSRTGRDGGVTYELMDLRIRPAGNLAEEHLARAGQYAWIDGADLGDMEYDPFVQKVLGSEHGHGAHAHHD